MKPIRFLSLFSGIEAASAALLPLGWECAAVAEIEPFPCAVLKHRYPDVPNLGDVTTITDEQITALGHIDVVIGGSPCQDLSIAGKRAGLGAARSSLFHQQVRIFDAARTLCGARFLWWENVPGAFSSQRGRDFALVVGAMAGCRFDVPGGGWRTAGAVLGPRGLVEWCTLDAQFFGLAQRRARVFVVLDTGDWSSRAPILLEPESLRGDPAPRRKAREDVAARPEQRAAVSSGNGWWDESDIGATLRAQDSITKADTLIAPPPLANPLTARMHKGINTTCDEGQTMIPVAGGGFDVAHSLRADGFDASEDGTGRGTPLVPVIAGTLGASHGNIKAEDAWKGNLVAFAQNQRDEVRQMDVAGALASEPGMKQQTYLQQSSAVRRLTPRECERLQGFPLTWESVTISACIDQQRRAVRVVLSCRKWPGDALPVVGGASPQSAGPAADRSNTRQAAPEQLAAVVVHTNSVDELHALHSRGRSLWSANGAVAADLSRLSMPPADIARAVARLLRDPGRSITDGAAELLLSVLPSTPAASGAEPAGVSGPAMPGSAAAAASGQNSEPFTTSDLGRLTPTCDSPTATWCCSALRVIAGFIPSGTLPETFSAELTVGTPYTLVTHRNKPAADGPRYKALGNSMAVPVIAWIGRRLDAVLRKPDLRSSA